MGQALVVKESDQNFHLRGQDGRRKDLPPNIYELAAKSDPYDSRKDFIGYVDVVIGVVLVDANSLIDEYNRHRQAAGETHSGHKLDDVIENKSLNSLQSSTYISGSRVASPQKNCKMHYCKCKTMHELAYEKKNEGRPLPDDNLRPISGFGIKQGKLVFNSSTFNGFEDDFHTDERDMGPVERLELQALIDRLNHQDLEKHSRVTRDDISIDSITLPGQLQ